MSHVLQNYLADMAEQKATDLQTALSRVPEEKWLWSPMGDARSAADMVAECALLNGSTAQTIEDRVFPKDFDFPAYLQQKAELRTNMEEVKVLLLQNTERVVAAIRAVPGEDLQNPIEMPWGPLTLLQLISYPNWNMGYHEGQINYIASLLGCLK